MDRLEQIQEYAHHAAAQAAIEAVRDGGSKVIRHKLEVYDEIYKGVFKTVRETFAALTSGK